MTTRRRRERGDGTLFYDEAKDRWVGQLDLGRDEKGKRLRPKVFGHTRTQARTRLDELARQHRAGQDVTQRATTFADLADLWLARGLPADIAENTRDNYTTIIHKHLTPTLGHRRLADLRPDDIETALDAMIDAGYSGRTMSLTLNLARRLLALAERRGLVGRNVATVIEAPRGHKRTRDGLTPEQARTLLAAARADRLGPLITLSLLLGLRPGEAAGLTWDAVNLNDTPPTLRIEHTLRRGTTGMTLVDAKTPTSHRTLALPAACVDTLRDQRRRQEADQLTAGTSWSNDSDLVFTTEVGTPLDPSNVRRSLNLVAGRAGLGHLHPHLLRHAAASLLSAAGVRLEDISDTLGHRSVSVTAEIYRHPVAPIRAGHLAAITALTASDPDPDGQGLD